jgi:hypothetical protein
MNSKNFLRLGFTETTLLFFYYLDLLKIENKSYLSRQNNLFDCLYTTSGFYDKSIEGNYANNLITESQVYNIYFSKLLNMVKNDNINLMLCFHDLPDNSLYKYKEDFLNYINFHDKCNIIGDNSILKFMNNKKILIINNLGSLMKKQFESGKIRMICNDFPDSVKSIEYLENGYTLFNEGPHKSILETSTHLCELIRKFEFDGAIVSAGAYSCLFTDFIINELKKEVFVIGGNLPLYFGIITKRVTMFSNDKINEHFIHVPDEMKPLGYEKVEGGCYW